MNDFFVEDHETFDVDRIRVVVRLRTIGIEVDGRADVSLSLLHCEQRRGEGGLEKMHGKSEVGRKRVDPCARDSTDLILARTHRDQRGI